MISIHINNNGHLTYNYPMSIYKSENVGNNYVNAITKSIVLLPLGI